MIFRDVDLKALFQLMQEHDVAETTLKDGKTEVIVKRRLVPDNDVAAVIERQLMNSSAFQGTDSVTSKEVAPHQSNGQTDEPGAQRETGEISDNFYTITAPLVGTFYRAPSPDSDPFIEVGDRVHVGDVLCIVEAMKSMNEIQSDVNGVVKEICVENSQIIEFEQTIFKIDTAG
jgi:acetyl-CoA carboxylase biotin carboxyl carrier protein